MTYDEVMKIALKVAETLEKNKNYIDELDEKLGDGNFGSALVDALKKSMEQIHKLDTKDLSVVINSIARIIIKFGGRVGKIYGQTLKEIGTKLAGQQELDLATLILMVDYIINNLKAKSRDKSITEHLKFWEEFRRSLASNRGYNKQMGILIKDTLNGLKWAYPATRSNAQSLVRVLVIRTFVKNL